MNRISRSYRSICALTNGLIRKTGCFTQRGLRPLVVAIAEVKKGPDGFFQRSTLSGAIVAVVLSLAIFSLVGSSLEAHSLMSQEAAAVHGLDRAWYSQVRLDPERSQVKYLTFFHKSDQLPDTLIVQTDRSTVQAINAETGQTLWVRLVGDPAQPTTRVGANDEMVSVINGTVLFILNRSNGKILWQGPVEGVPVEGTIMSDRYVYVPQVNGHISAYRIEKEKSVDFQTELAAKQEKIKQALKKSTSESDSLAVVLKREKTTSPSDLKIKSGKLKKLCCVSFGRLASNPILIQKGLAGNQIAWTTNKGLFVGFINVKSAGKFRLQYQWVSSSELATSATFYPWINLELSKHTNAVANDDISSGLILTASTNGQVSAVYSRTGEQAWKYSLGESVTEPVIPVDSLALLITKHGNLVALDAVGGKPLWKIGGVRHFLAASKDRLYVEDSLGRIKVVRQQDGVTVDSIRFDGFSHLYRNLETDRIYLASRSGMVVCLHESRQAAPMRHQEILASRARELAKDSMVARVPRSKRIPTETSMAKKPLAQDSPFASAGAKVKKPKRKKGEPSNNPF
jgi:outer membrane protein assembly factor BamB